MYIKMFKVSRSCLKEILLACWLNMNVLLLLAISYLSFSGGSVGKNPPANTGDARDAVSIPGTRRSLGVGNGGNTTQIFLSGKFPGQRSLVGYSPWGHKESRDDQAQHSVTYLLCSRHCTGFPSGSAGKISASNWETWVQSPGWEDPLDKGKATQNSNILAWRIPGTI